MKIRVTTKKLWIFGSVDIYSPIYRITKPAEINIYLKWLDEFENTTKGHFLMAYWKVRNTIIESIKGLYQHKPFFYYGELVVMPYRAHNRIRDLQ